MSRNPAVTISLFAGGIIALGYGIAQYGSKKSVGLQIPENKEALRIEGAQGQAVKAGMSPEEAVDKIKSVPTKGGDKGMKSLDA